MTNPSADEERISELLWRTVKLRASLLALALVVLLIAWSAVLSGDERAKSVDVDYCKHLAVTNDTPPAQNSTQPSHAAPTTDEISTCSEPNARSYIEGTRAFDALWRDLGNSSEAVQKFRENRERLISDYDVKRKASYNFRIQLSSEVSSGEASVNALTVAEAVPFLTLGLVAIVVILGFQQRAYRVRLVLLTEKSKDPTALALARTQFFTFSSFAARQNSWGVKWPVLSVEGVAVGGLAAALALALAGLVSAFAENVIHLTDSIFHNYLSNLYGFAFLLTFCLLYTRRSYGLTLESDAESKLASRPSQTSRRFAEGFLAAAALIAVLLPWAVTPSGLSLKGYFFIFPQRPQAGVAGSTFFPVSQQLFSELRWRLAITLVFILLCVIETFLRRRSRLISGTWPSALRAALAILTLYWSLNLLLYMGVLEYEAIRGTSWSVHNTIFSALRGNAPGLPLDTYDPSYGFVVFLAASLALTWLSLRSLFRNLTFSAVSRTTG